jgi:hypothetical protein
VCAPLLPVLAQGVYMANALQAVGSVDSGHLLSRSGTCRNLRGILPELPFFEEFFEEAVSSAWPISSPTPVTVRLFEVLSSKLAPSSVLVNNPIERELRYFALLRTIRDKIDLESLPYQTISQSYFPAELVPVLSCFAFRAAGRMTEFEGAGVKRARIRRTENPQGTVRHSLEVKGPKQDFERLDLSIPIEPALYEHLRDYTDGSYLVKKRYQDGGLAGRDKKVTLHIDVMYQIGPGGELERPGKVGTRSGKVGFAIVEAEAEDAEAIQLVLAGRHQLALLKAAVPLWKYRNSKQGPLSSWSLAHRGVDKNLRKAVHYFARKAG